MTGSRKTKHTSPKPLQKTAREAKRTRRKSPSADVEPGVAATEKLAKIAGLPAVSSLFRNDPQRVMRLYYEERLKNAVGAFCAELARLRRPYRMVSGEELAKVAGTALHGGVVAAATPRPIPDLDLATAQRWADGGEPLIILDGVGNPHNLGAIVRTLAFFGFRHLAISDHPDQAAPSDAAYRVAEGGLEFVEVYKIRNLPRFLHRLQTLYCVVGTALADNASALETLTGDNRPFALVLGNEEHGIPPPTLAACEASVTIRGAGQVQSLNVSATAAIFLHELARRRGLR